MSRCRISKFLRLKYCFHCMLRDCGNIFGMVESPENPRFTADLAVLSYVYHCFRTQNAVNTSEYH